MKKAELKECLRRDAESLRSLSFSESYIQESLTLTERWGSTGLLNGLSDPYVARQVARLLENQRLLNESQGAGTGVYGIPKGAQTSWNDAQWRRVSVPAIRRVFGAFVPYHLVSVQAVSKPEDRFYHTGLDERQNSGIITAKTRSVGRDWWVGGEMLGENGRHDIELEAQALAIFSQRYANEVTNEIIRDLRNNSGSYAHAEYQDQEHLLSLVEGMSAYIAAKIKGRDATWIVANPVVCDILRPFVTEWNEGDPSDDEQVRLSVKYRGLVKDKWKLYEAPLQVPGKVLMGHKDSKNHYFSGYFYCPFYPFTQQPGWWTEDQHQHTVLYARYGKKLVDANFYGVIDISNLPEPKVETPAEEEIVKTESEA